MTRAEAAAVLAEHFYVNEWQALSRKDRQHAISKMEFALRELEERYNYDLQGDEVWFG